MSEGSPIPLFPLSSVLVPNGRLPLQIFERRYIDLVSNSLKTGTGFGVCLLKKGKETITAGRRQEVHRVGCYAHIVDWDQLENGLLGITVEGSLRFHVRDCWSRDDHLLMADVGWLDGAEAIGGGESSLPVSDDQAFLVELLQDLTEHPLVESLGLDMDIKSRQQLSWRLIELLPAPMAEKQRLLEIGEADERIKEIEVYLAAVMRHGGSYTPDSK